VIQNSKLQEIAPNSAILRKKVHRICMRKIRVIQASKNDLGRWPNSHDLQTAMICFRKNVYREISRYESGGIDRADRGSEKRPRKTTDFTSIGAPRARPIRCSPLPVPQTISTNVRNCRKVRQANRAYVIASFQIAESMGFKGRISPMGGPAADRKMIAEFCISRFFRNCGESRVIASNHYF
jgi:hypothetical protein